MYNWNDEVATRPGAVTVISDVYKAMQTRLDGYRQGAGAIMLGIVAGAFAIDATFVRLFLDKELVSSLAKPSDYSFYFVVLGAGIFVEGLFLTGLLINRIIGQYFAEMSSIIYKIDEANGMWRPDFWINGQTLYPKKFRIPLELPEQRSAANVSRDKTVDPHLYGWRDPTIRRYQRFTFWLMVLHLILYGSLATIGKAPFWCWFWTC